MKAVLTYEPVLMASGFDKPFKLVINASNISFGDVLVQNDEDEIDHPMRFHSKKLNKYQKSCSAVEKEPLALTVA